MVGGINQVNANGKSNARANASRDAKSKSAATAEPIEVTGLIEPRPRGPWIWPESNELIRRKIRINGWGIKSIVLAKIAPDVGQIKPQK